MVDERVGGHEVRSLREEGRDLFVVAACDVLAVGFLLGPAPRIAVLDTLVALGFLFGLPGYAFLAALFPDHESAGRNGGWNSGKNSWSLALTGFERVAFAVAGSLALVMLVGGALAFSSYGLHRFTVAVAVGLLTLGLTGVAARRRAVSVRRERSGHPDDAGRPDDAGHPNDATGAGRPPSRADVPSPFAVGLVVVCLVAVAGIGGIALLSDEQYTEASVLSRADNGTLLADAHPDTVPAGEPTQFWVRVSNHEGRSLLYTVVVRLERVGDDPTTVESARELGRDTVAVPVGGTRTVRPEITPAQPGHVRVQFLVYERAVPESPSPANADHALHVWLTVEDRQTEGGT